MRDILTIHVGSTRLTDGSEVFNVYVGTDCKSPYPAYSREDAEALAEGLVSLINHHSLQEARVKVW